MKVFSKFLILSALALIVGLIFAPAAAAQIPEASFLRIDQPLDVGGTILQPGAYVIRVLPLSDRNYLQVTNEDRTKVFATVLSIPHAIGASEEQTATEYVLYPATAGSPRALRTWFAPGATSHGGHDIVYPEKRALELAALANQPVVAYKDETKAEELKTAQLEVVTPEKAVKPYVVEPAPAPKPVMVAETRELPHSASQLPLFATLGLLLLAAAVGIRVFRMM